MIWNTQTQHLFGKDINKSLNRAKGVGNLKKQMFPETSRSIKSSFEQFPKTSTHFFFVQESKQLKGIPQQVQELLVEILQDLEKQAHHYIRLVPTIRKFL